MKEIFAVVKLLQRKPRKKIWGSNGIQTHDLHDIGTMLYQWCEFNLYPLYEENAVKYIIMYEQYFFTMYRW